MIKTLQQIEIQKQGGIILGKGLSAVMAAAKPGVSTLALDDIFVTTVRSLGGEPAFLGYKGYPKSICTSINDEVVHGIPGKRRLKEGDLFSLDGGLRYKGLCTDMARTMGIGKISASAQKLLSVTQTALALGVAVAKAGNTIGDIGFAIKNYVEKNGFSVVRSLVGHGIGTEVHEEPQVPNFGKKGQGKTLTAGMVLAIEPMVNIGQFQVNFSQDGWTITTKDGTLSAHFEDTIAITKKDPQILTKLAL